MISDQDFRTLAKNMVDNLNRALELDPEAIRRLVNGRVEVNNELSTDTSMFFVTMEEDGTVKVGPVGY